MTATFVSRDGFVVRVEEMSTLAMKEVLIRIVVGRGELDALTTSDIEQLEHVLRCVREQAERDNRRGDAVTDVGSLIGQRRHGGMSSAVIQYEYWWVRWSEEYRQHMRRNHNGYELPSEAFIARKTTTPTSRASLQGGGGWEICGWDESIASYDLDLISKLEAPP
jgi:hypothetical protein